MEPKPPTFTEKPKEQANEEISTTELVNAFEDNGLPLDFSLKCSLLGKDTHKSHSEIYRDVDGSGFTEASRVYLAKAIRNRRQGEGVELFDAFVISAMRTKVIKDLGYEPFAKVDVSPYIDKDKLRTIESAMTKPETKLVARMIGDIFGTHEKDPNIPELPTGPRIVIGACSKAESYFYDFLSPDNYLFHHTIFKGKPRINIIVDNSNEAILMEKIGLGNEHSAITLKDFYSDGVRIPAGSLVVIRYSLPKEEKEINSGKGNIIKTSDLTKVEFLRFTPLVLDSKDRKRVFEENLSQQIEDNFYNPETITIDDFRKKAQEEIAGKI